MDLSSLDPSADPSLDLARSARRRVALRADRRSMRSCRPAGSAPETAAVVDGEQQTSEGAEAPAPAPGKAPRQRRATGAAARDRSGHPAPKSGRKTLKSKFPERESEPSEPESERPARKLVLDVNAVAEVEGLEQEVAVLRASIRQLASDEAMTVHVKVLAELRHQIEALCRVLKTQQSLAGQDDDGRAAEMARMLEELGDDLGVAR